MDQLIAKASRPERVWLVDDDAGVLSVYSGMLAAAGHACQAETDPVVAYDSICNDPAVAVVILDLQMPGFGGLELLRRLRTEFADRPWLQVVVVTGQASLDSAIDALRMEAVEYLCKPVPAAQLTAVVGDALLRAQQAWAAAPAVANAGYLARLREVADIAGQLVTHIRGMQPSAVEQPAQQDKATQQSALHFISQLQEARRSLFRGIALPESSWEILLELMSTEIAGRNISVSGLCLAANCPVTTALRRIDELADLGLISKQVDPTDARRLYVRMTEAGRYKMQSFLSQVAANLSAKVA
jgi:DNA-binding response OmpR family regulator